MNCRCCLTRNNYNYRFVRSSLLSLLRSAVTYRSLRSSSRVGAAPVSTSDTSSLHSRRQTYLERINRGPGLRDFLNATTRKGTQPLTPSTPAVSSPTIGNEAHIEEVPYLPAQSYSGQGRKVFLEIYGCQMNNNDAEVVWSILHANDYQRTTNIDEAGIVVLMTCAIREGAETKVWNRLHHLRALKEKRLKRHRQEEPLQIAVLGCMAERLKQRLVEREQTVDVVAGPDSYKDLPRLFAVSRHYDQSAINVLLSLDETYADIVPIRLNADSTTAFVSIMRGCDNMCSYCIVPFTRGRERSRPLASILAEVKALWQQGVKEVTLLGQNVNSYRDRSQEAQVVGAAMAVANTAPGFKTVYKPRIGGVPFSELLRQVAESVPEMRIRFTSPHPKDFSLDVLEVMRDHSNICKNIHLPAQSGNDEVLARMRRGYTREAYLSLVDTIRSYLPGVGLSSDFICGFCDETEAEFEETLSLMSAVRYNVAYLFAYSMREKTTAHRRYQDNVPRSVKVARLQRMAEVYRRHANELHRSFIGCEQLVLIEGHSKRSKDFLYGRNEANIKVIIPIERISVSVDDPLSSYSFLSNGLERETPRSPQVGDFVSVRIEDANSQVLKGTPLSITTIRNFYNE